MARVRLSAKFDFIPWLAFLSLVAVGLRNFEEGLSSDAPLYATIARNIARSGEWFWLHGSVPEYAPWVDHPHLGFWFLAAVLKVLPAADWSVRIPGQIFYFGFLLLFYKWVQIKSGQKVALWATLFLWSWSRFSNFFSNVYLDPGCLFFGALAVFLLDQKKWSFFAGACLAFCAMFKGVTFLGFLPAIAYIGISDRKCLKRFAFAALGFFSIFAIYVISIKFSRIPDFLERYWASQITGRYGQTWSLWGLFNSRFWLQLFKDTNWLAPLAIVVLRNFRKDEMGVPLCLFLTFILMYAPAERVGTQYWLMLMPWIAWMLASSFARFAPWRPERVRKLTLWLCILVVCAAQYFPLTVHGMPPDVRVKEMRTQLRDEQRLVMIAPEEEMNFLASARLAWYGDRVVRYTKENETLPAVAGEKDITVYSNKKGDTELKQSGWCLHADYGKTQLWKKCP